MVKLFVSDIDGCLSVAYQPFALGGFQVLARYVAEAGGVHPPVSLCSGRPYPYVEAVTQALGLRAPVLFESGGGLFDPLEGRVFWHPAFTDELADQLGAVRRWLRDVCLPGTSMMIDLGKQTQAGIIGPIPEEVRKNLPVVRRHIAARYPALRVFHTEVSIDVVAAGLTKEHGLSWLARRRGMQLEEVAYIGDTDGDVDALRAVGFAFAPANATRAAQEAARMVTAGRVMDGVLEAYRWCVDRNKAEAACIL